MTIITGDCLTEMAKMPDNSIDFIVTDPPYGLYFMGKDWDSSIPSMGYWQQALRICKPGSMLAAFGGSRTHHHLMLAIESAGWEIRDVIMWIYGSGFPKSNNFGKNRTNPEWHKFGTALKPAYEPIILAMKKLDGTFNQNAQRWGCSGINIDDSRIETTENLTRDCLGLASSVNEGYKRPYHEIAEKKVYGSTKGRWPANIILDEEAAEQLDQMSGVSKSPKAIVKGTKSSGGILNRCEGNRLSNSGHGDSGGASRFFYCPKASSRERNEGLEGIPIISCGTGALRDNGIGKLAQNTHPTVKPISLMKYIIKLLAPPGNPTLLDPFAGSGSTLVAATELGINSIGIELSEEYSEIARKRIEHAKNKDIQYDLFEKNEVNYDQTTN